MIFSAPISFREALRSVAARSVMPTNLGTAELQALGRGVLQRSFFSARTTLEGYLDTAKGQIQDLVEGQVDPATVRLKLKDTLQSLGYQPDPDQRGTLQDLSSDKRLDLVIKTNTEVAQGFAYDRQGQDESILDQWPALELFRAESRAKERDWPARWRLAGQATGDPIGSGWTITPDGRMIALKNHPLWDQLGNPALFDDGIDNGFPPFAFNSGMDVQDVTREEAMEFGLIDRDTQIPPKPVDYQFAA